MPEDFAVYGLDLHIPIPKESLAKFIYQSMIQNLNETAFIDGITEETLSFKDVLNTTCRLANSLQNAGYTKNDLLGICSENSIHFFPPFIAALFAGLTTVLISHTYLEDELEHAINITGPKIIFCSKNTVDKCIRLKEKNKSVKKLIVMGVDEDVPGAESLNSFIMGNCNKSIHIHRFMPVDVDEEDPIVLVVFSSGTSGLPKGVMITQKNCLMRIVHAYDPRFNFNSQNNKLNLGYLPFYHVYGLMLAIGSIALGKPTVVVPKFEERLFLSCIQKYEICAIDVVPTILALLAKSTAVDEYDLSSLKAITSGAAPVSEALEKEIKSRLKLDVVNQVYGMSETTFAVLGVPNGVEKNGSCGTVMPGMVCVVRDSDKNVGPNQVGEFCFKGGMLMKGYYKNPKATTEAFTNDGWFKTGDLGYYDDDGYFYIVDRLKDLIKYKSFQVPPFEIETLLLKNPKIKEAAVLGVPDEVAGELPMAFVVKQPNIELSEADVVKYVADRLSRHKHLHGGVRFVDALPKGTTGKILKRELKQMLKTLE